MNKVLEAFLRPAWQYFFFAGIIKKRLEKRRLCL